MLAFLSERPGPLASFIRLRYAWNMKNKRVCGGAIDGRCTRWFVDVRIGVTTVVAVLVTVAMTSLRTESALAAEASMNQASGKTSESETTSGARVAKRKSGNTKIRARKSAKKKSGPALTEKSAKVRSDKLARPGTQGPVGSVPVASSARPTNETAFRTIGIAVFIDAGAPPGFGDGGAVRFCEEIASELNAKSYMVATCLKQSMTGEEGAPLLSELARKRSVDSLLVGQVSANGVEMRLVSGTTGRVIGQFKGEVATKFEGAGRKKMIDSSVEALVEQIPFRGYLVDVEGDEVEINLGETHGVREGTMLQVFEFSGTLPTLASASRVLGVVQITEVMGPDLSVGRIVDRRGVIASGAKIAHQDAEPPKRAATARVTTGDDFWISAGPEFLTIDSKIKGIKDLNREYKMSSTPFVQIGMGGERWFTSVWYGYASDDEETLSYASLVGAYHFRTVGGFRSGYTVSAGAWISQYSSSVKRRTLTRILDDSTRYSPYLEVRYQHVFGSRIMLFASGEVYYPVFATGQQSSQVPFSYGLGASPGARFHVNDWLSLEGGIRFQYLTLPLAGDKGTRETHNGMFVRAVFLL